MREETSDEVQRRGGGERAAEMNLAGHTHTHTHNNLNLGFAGGVT
jgi:hypothetical protein